MRRRSPYKRIRIESISRSELIKDEEDRWRLLTPDGKNIFRVWIMGIVTRKSSEENNFSNLKVEDGSGAIQVRAEEGVLDRFHHWDKIEVLGQIRFLERNDEIIVIIIPDIIEHIKNDNWFLFHRLKIVQERLETKSVEVKPAIVGGVELEGAVSFEDLKNKLKLIVKNLDTGAGVTLEQISQELSDIDEAQIFDAITELLETGEFFEPKVGTYSSAIDS